MVIPLVAQQSGSFLYSSSGGAITITGYTGVGGAVEIPSAIADLPVRTIGSSAFSAKTSLTSVTIPDTIISIEGSAFRNCTGLTSVSMGSHVAVIGNNAFQDCVNLASVSIPGSVTNFGGSVFRGCRSLASATIGSGVTSIGSGAFNSCLSLVSLIIPDSITSIGSGAFAGCTSLTGIAIPNRVTSISSSLFYGCTGLSTISIPNSVTTIGEGAFRGCAGLTSLVLPDSTTSIGEGAFWECAGLTNITIPGSVTLIGDWAFRDCQSLLNIETAAGNTAYRSVDGVLFNIDLTTLIQYPAGKAGSYVIPSGVITIEGTAFERCRSMTSVTIPDSVTTVIGSFNDCTNLASAIFEGNAPDSFDVMTFSGAASLFTVYYHEGSIGFTSPTWLAYLSVALGAPGQPVLEDWRQEHFGEGATNTGEAADSADPDGDGWTNWEEFASGTDPKKAASFFQMQSAEKGFNTFTVAFEAQPGRRYALMRLLDAPGEIWHPVAILPEAVVSPASIFLTDLGPLHDTALYRVHILVP